MIPFPSRSAEQYRVLVLNSQFAAQRVNDLIAATAAAMDLDPAEHDFDATGPGFVRKPKPAAPPVPAPPDPPA